MDHIPLGEQEFSPNLPHPALMSQPPPALLISMLKKKKKKRFVKMQVTPSYGVI